MIKLFIDMHMSRHIDNSFNIVICCLSKPILISISYGTNVAWSIKEKKRLTNVASKPIRKTSEFDTRIENKCGTTYIYV